MTARERDATMRLKKPCVRYAMLIPVALALSSSAIADTIEVQEEEESLTEIIVTGGIGRPSQPVFMQTENFAEDLDEVEPQ